jgi:hypothetical protein
MAFLNRCIWTAASSGLGDFVVSAAAQNGYTPAQCLTPTVVNGATYHYIATNGTEHEEGDGAYNTATSTLARTTIRNSSNSHAKVTFSAAPVVTMGGPVANDMPGIGSAIASGTSGSVLFLDTSGNLAQDNANLSYNAASHTLSVTNLAFAGTAGSILFAGPGNLFAEDPTNLFWDYTNHILKINAELDFQATTIDIHNSGGSLVDYGISRTATWTFQGGNVFVGKQATGTISSVQQLVIANYINSGSTGPNLLFNNNNANGFYGWGPAAASGSDCRFWFGQVDAPYYNTVWDTSTTAGHVAHFEIFNGSLGLGSGGTVDAYLTRDAANIVGLKNIFSLTTAQTLRVYNTTDATNTNYERGIFDWAGTANVLTIGTQKGGTGTARNLQFVIDGTSKLNYGVSRSAKWTTQADFWVGTVANVGASLPKQINMAEYQSSGTFGPSFLMNGFAFELQPAIGLLNASDKAMVVGQADVNSPWDWTKLCHWYLPNGSLGLGAAGTVDAFVSRSAAGVVAFGSTSTLGDSSATIRAKTKAGAPSASDVPAGTWALIRDTSNSTTKLYYNNGGSLQTVALV